MTQTFGLPLMAMCLVLAGCAQKNVSTRIDYQMGERVTVGPLTYNVLDSVWKSQLGELFQIRLPRHRFLILTLTVTNGGGNETGLSMLTLEGANGESFQELDRGDGVEHWMGLLRAVNVAQTLEGKIVFDVPLSAYKLKVTDGGEPGREKIAFVEIPLRLETDAPIATMPTK